MSDVTITIDGTDRTEHLVRLERRVEYCNPWQTFEAVFDANLDISTWKSVVIYENGTLVFTGSTSQIEKSDEPLKTTVRGADDIKRLREYFVSEEYTTDGSTRAAYWINKFAIEAGCTIVFEEPNNPVVPPDMTIGLMSAWEIIDELLLLMGLDIWCDATNVLHVGFVMEITVTHTIAAGTNLTEFARQYDSESPRNACVVYGTAGSHAYYHADFGWEIDDNDIRKMVVANPYFVDNGSAFDLAYRMVQAAGPTYDIKRCQLDDVYQDIEVGDKVAFDDGKSNTGTGNVTSVTTTWDGMSGNIGMYVAIDERCPRIGANGGGPGDLIIATYEYGVWHTADIFADYPHWEPLNNGLDNDLHYVCVQCAGCSIPVGSSYKCDNFVRDPFDPNNHAYLLTEVGLLETHSLTSGSELWEQVIMNADSGLLVGVYSEGGDSPFGITKISANYARQGEYHIVLHAAYGSKDHSFFVAAYDNFAETISGPYEGNYCDGHYPPECYLPIPQPNPPCNAPPSGCPKVICCAMWGTGYNYGWEESVAIPSWHHHTYYASGNGGGLATWSTPDYRGAMASGIASSVAANGEPAMWFTGPSENMGETLCGYDYNKAVTTQNWIADSWYGIGGWVAFKQPGPGLNLRIPGLSAPWLHGAGIHLPMDVVYAPVFTDPLWPSEYDPDYELIPVWGAGPTLWWCIPGEWIGEPEITEMIPCRFTNLGGASNVPRGMCSDYWVGNEGDKTYISPPWGPDAIECHTLSDSLGTFATNCEYAYMFSGGSTASRFAYSNNAATDPGGGTWTEGCTVPHATGAFAYDRRNYRMIYVGRHAETDPAMTSHDDPDIDVIWATNTRGTSMWHDGTGDLVDQCIALGFRRDGYNEPLGPSGIVAISPRP